MYKDRQVKGTVRSHVSIFALRFRYRTKDQIGKGHRKISGMQRGCCQCKYRSVIGIQVMGRDNWMPNFDTGQLVRGLCQSVH